MKIQTNETRQHILDMGYELIVAKGFTSVGLSMLLKHAQIPKGSFYHYFKSKEQFGETLITDYFAKYMQWLNALFTNKQLPANERLLNYFKHWIVFDQGVCGAQRCLVVKLSAEVSDLSEPMRLALNKGANDVVLAIAQCVESGIHDGSIKVTNAQETAEILYQIWLGASILYKLSKDVSGLQRTLQKTEHILQGS
ncbi:TetR/AcrR family transcriptional regulator [Colwellia sp. MB3u-70]|uniref:TetR/AcrR family transcriptional regulator n=1 Tax=unclassified Colwellia TaxID=196834 RepID=UPI0015F66E83|nr:MULTISPECIES: TetR/AcrR family transcriptional regulator [unclassified Colwellia]MBA6293926.1 TetR/AcrR family transcriptional regulator [Colwellia sp. MB3u-8]MBA6306874.1 TetR/AcrR family transcriptional regulator [Colwellia sp. MB3u-70]